MRTIKEMIIAGVVGIFFISAVTLLIYSTGRKERLEETVYRENRNERILLT